MVQKSDLFLVRKVNLKMRDQKCEAIRVVGGNTNWEDFYWPQDIRELDQEVREMLQRLKLMEYEEVFKKEELSFTDIAKMDHGDLQSIGITSVKHRKAIMKYFPGTFKLQIGFPLSNSTRQEEFGGEASTDTGGVDVQSGSVASCPTSTRQTGGEAKTEGESTSANSTPSEGPQNGAGMPGSSQSSTASVVLTSTGPSARNQGSRLGVFDYLQQYNKCPAYRQRHSGTKTKPNYLYRDEYDGWCVGKELGSSSSIGLLNKTKSDTLPSTNWLYFNGKGQGNWQSDPELTLSTSLPSVCPVIKISLHGTAAKRYPRAGGEYRPTGGWSCGHPVFRNGDRYLCVVPWGTAWSVREGFKNISSVT